MSDETNSTPTATGEELRARVESIKAREAARDDADRAEVAASLERIIARAKATQETRQSLPCFGNSDETGVSACEAVEAWRGCEFWQPDRPGADAMCPRVRVRAIEAERAARTPTNLGDDSGVPAEHVKVLLAAARGETKPITAGALGAVVAWIARGADRERILALVGPTGVGKSLAACYAIAREGGRYCKAAQIVRPDFDLTTAEEAHLLVIDQFGREHAGASEFGRLQIEDLIDTRFANCLPTILCGNLTREQFDTRYQDVIADRFRGGGLWVALAGDSLRGRGV